jgi:hypothetical protein
MRPPALRTLAIRPPVLFALLALALAGLVIFSAMRRAPEADAMAAQAPVVIPSTVYPDGRDPMVLPANYQDTFALYAAIDRPDSVTRRIYISPAAIDAVRAGTRLPERTQIIVEAYDAARDADGHLLHDADGHLIPADLKPEIHIAELRSTWQIEDLAASSHVGGLNFASFESSGARTSEILSECFSCHDATASRGFLFTNNQLRRYATTGETQYVYCPLPGRVPC